MAFLVKLDMGAKNPYGGFLLLKFPVKKVMTSFSDVNIMFVEHHKELFEIIRQKCEKSLYRVK